MACGSSMNYVSYHYIGTVLLPTSHTNRPVGVLYSVIRMLQSLDEIVLHGHLSVGDMLLISFVLSLALRIRIS
jgi:hypothetical protein